MLSGLCVSMHVLTTDNSGYCLSFCLSDAGRKDADHSVTHPADCSVSAVCSLFTPQSTIYLQSHLVTSLVLSRCREIDQVQCTTAAFLTCF